MKKFLLAACVTFALATSGCAFFEKESAGCSPECAAACKAGTMECAGESCCSSK